MDPDDSDVTRVVNQLSSTTPGVCVYMCMYVQCVVFKRYLNMSYLVCVVHA